MNKENYNDQFEINILDLLLIVKKNIILFLAILLLCTAAGYAYSSFYLSETFQTSAKIIIVKEEGTSTNASITYSDVQLSQKLASTYKQIIMSEAVSDEVVKNLDLTNKYGITSQSYGGIVSVSAAENTEVMNISVQTTDPQLSADIANEILKVFMSKIYEIMDVQNVTVLNYAKVPTKKSGPSISKYSAIGALIGAVICGIITLIKYFADTKVKTEEQIKAIFPNYPIIGSIPEIEIKEAKKHDE